jgi:hypothetical protein
VREAAQLGPDLPSLIVRAGRDGLPHVNDTIDHSVGAGRSKGIPLTKIDVENGIHGFDYEQKPNRRSGEIVKQALKFMTEHLAVE